MKKLNNILIVDSLAGISVGLGSFVLSPYLYHFFGWSKEFLYFMASVNLIYGCYSGILFLASQKSSKPRENSWIVLVLGNAVWGGHCFAQVFHRWESASVWGLSTLVFEGIFVIGLAFFEFKALINIWIKKIN